jgi:heat-inducible transcriptional repressor
MREVALSVLEEYIKTALPVASASVARRSVMSVSPATVRATMAELTDLGLLSQPHSSAGRVPTDRAFRLYVDHLMGDASRMDLVPSDVGRDLAKPAGDVEEFIRHAADLLSEATGQLGFFLSAAPGQIPLQHVHFVRVSTERVTVLLVMAGGGVQTRIIEERDSDQRTLDDASTRLSELVAGCTLGEARARLVGAEAELYVGDKNPLLSHPEFSDAHLLRKVLCALEEKQRVMRLLDKIIQADVLSVVIGSELEDPSIQECAVVTAPLGDPPAYGGLGVIGPVRMRYDRVIPVVRYVSEQVTHCIS